MGHFKQLPKGLGGMGENIRRQMVAVDLDDLAVAGNRAQRRYAQKKLAAIQRSKSAACADVSTHQANHSADVGASITTEGIS